MTAKWAIFIPGVADYVCVRSFCTTKENEEPPKNVWSDLKWDKVVIVNRLKNSGASYRGGGKAKDSIKWLIYPVSTVVVNWGWQVLLKNAEKNDENEKRLPFHKAFLHPNAIMNGKTLQQIFCLLVYKQTYFLSILLIENVIINISWRAKLPRMTFLFCFLVLQDVQFLVFSFLFPVCGYSQQQFPAVGVSVLMCCLCGWNCLQNWLWLLKNCSLREDSHILGMACHCSGICKILAVM